MALYGLLLCWAQDRWFTGGHIFWGIPGWLFEVYGCNKGHAEAEVGKLYPYIWLRGVSPGELLEHASTGNIYISDYNGEIWIVSLTGDILNKFTAEGDLLFVLNNGNVCLLSGDKLSCYSTKGVLLWTLSDVKSASYCEEKDEIACVC